MSYSLPTLNYRFPHDVECNHPAANKFLHTSHNLIFISRTMWACIRIFATLYTPSKQVVLARFFKCVYEIMPKELQFVWNLSVAQHPPPYTSETQLEQWAYASHITFQKELGRTLGGPASLASVSLPVVRPPEYFRVHLGVSKPTSLHPLITNPGKMFWGPILWAFIHTFGMLYTPHHQYVTNPNPPIESPFTELMYLLVDLIGCNECREHLRINLQTLNIHDYTSSSSDMFRYTYILHDLVNKQITAANPNKPEHISPPLNDVYKWYKQSIFA